MSVTLNIANIIQGNGVLSVAFNASGGGVSNISSYEYSTDSGSSWKLRTDNSLSVSSPISITKISGSANTDLSNGIPYTILIRAKNSGGGTITQSNTVSNVIPYLNTATKL